MFVTRHTGKWNREDKPKESSNTTKRQALRHYITFERMRVGAIEKLSFRVI